MRILFVASTLFTASCSVNSQYSNPKLVSSISKIFEARDACLAKHAVPYAGDDMDASSIARAVSLSCQAETEKLIAISNLNNDPKVAAAIRQNTEFRATGYVLKARGQLGLY